MQCSKRDDETQVAIKERTSSIQIENSVLRVAQTTSEVRGDTGSELKLQWCWQRRGVAFDRCGLIRTEQLIRADRELFTILSQEQVGSLKPDAAGVSPLDDSVRALITGDYVHAPIAKFTEGHQGGH